MKSSFAKKFLIGASLGLLLTIALIGWKNAKVSHILKNLPREIPLVETMLIQKKNWPLAITEVGIIKARDEVDVTSLVTGHLEELSVRPGQVVKKGDILFVLEHSAAQAAYEKSVASSKLAQLKFERYKQLWQEQSIPQYQFDEAKSFYNQAQFTEKEAKVYLDHHYIKASIDGVVDYFKLSPGSLVNSAKVLTRVYASQPYDIEFSISQQYAHWIKEGSIVKLQDKHETHFAEVVSLGVGCTLSYPRLRSLAALKKETSFLPGQTIPITLEVDTESLHFVIPQLAIDYTSLGTVIWVVDETQKVKPVLVDTYRFKDGCAAIKSDDLQEGIRIVSMGQQKLRNNMKVNFNESSS